MEEISSAKFNHQSYTPIETLTEQYFPVMQFIMRYKVVLTFESIDEIIYSVTIQMKATEQYFPVALFTLCLLCCTF